MKITGKIAVITGFAAGMACGLTIYHAAIKFGGFTLVNQQAMENQQRSLNELKLENRELTEELFRPRESAWEPPVSGEPPYDTNADAAAIVAGARVSAVQNKKFLMVTFGANWCRDCRNLHWVLQQEEVEAYTSDLFQFVNVDVGKFNQNRDVAEELGVSLTKGIPVAIFFDPQGQVIGTTNEGELEPARHYSSKQILKFIRDVVEKSRISAPDSVH